MNNTKYRKSESQVTIERALLSLRERGLTPSMLKANPEYTSLDKAFSNSLTELILVLLHEQDTHALITSIANAYTSQYYEDKHEYDLLYEAVSLTFLGLYSTIKKSTTKMINGKPVKSIRFLISLSSLYTILELTYSIIFLQILLVAMVQMLNTPNPTQQSLTKIMNQSTSLTP